MVLLRFLGRLLLAAVLYHRATLRNHPVMPCKAGRGLLLGTLAQIPGIHDKSSLPTEEFKHELACGSIRNVSKPVANSFIDGIGLPHQINVELPMQGHDKVGQRVARRP